MLGANFELDIKKIFYNEIGMDFIIQAWVFWPKSYVLEWIFLHNVEKLKLSLLF